MSWRRWATGNRDSVVVGETVCEGRSKSEVHCIAKRWCVVDNVSKEEVFGVDRKVKYIVLRGVVVW